MDLQGGTRNQHFVSQVEQRLNAINPSANEKNQKIYAFGLVDRESYKIKLKCDRGFKIDKTLRFNDLFSFEVLKKESARYNFEKLFHQYESDIKTNTQSLISKLPIAGADIKAEISDIFVSKLLNFIRNPYSIKKVLNTFPQMTDVHPTNPVHQRNFERVLNGRKPQQKYLCEQLGISELEYANWLSSIFLLLTPLEEGQPNFFEQIVKGLYENPDTYIMVFLYTYNDKTCLLSDSGYSNPLPEEEEHMAFDFNLCSKAFIRYMFMNIDSLAPDNASKEPIERLKSRQKSINVYPIVNNLDKLGQYNKRVVYQCFNTVFNSSTECYGL